MSPTVCPCLSGLVYDECCGPVHQSRSRAATAEALMRSRFSAFAVGNAEYLRRTWHATTRPRDLTLNSDLRWYRLDVLHVSRGGILDADGTVEFRAFYRAPEGAGSQHEVSRFVREGGEWRYLDAVG